MQKKNIYVIITTKEGFVKKGFTSISEIKSLRELGHKVEIIK